jgi:anionic cell wall polymer biosynthesis LytR-Cps2A-Psr (LCP) family protein
MEVEKGRYYMFRVNSAYQIGGSKGATRTVRALVNTPVNYYMEVNMKASREHGRGLRSGVDVNVPFTFTYHTHFKKGKQHLNGKEASRLRADA